MTLLTVLFWACCVLAGCLLALAFDMSQPLLFVAYVLAVWCAMGLFAVRWKATD